MKIKVIIFVMITCLFYSGFLNSQVVELNWNTFLGTAGVDWSYDLTLDSSGNIYVTGMSDVKGSDDLMVVCLNSSGNPLWYSVFGSSLEDWGAGITVDNSGKTFVTGCSEGTWGSPINAFTGDYNAFVARLSPLPVTDIKANGSDEPIGITQSDTLKINVSLNTFGLTANVDFWLAYNGPTGWFHYNNTTKTWDPGLGVTHQGALMDLNSKKVFQQSGLTPGAKYTFYFGVDLNMDGNLTKSELIYDEVSVDIAQ